MGGFLTILRECEDVKNIFDTKTWASSYHLQYVLMFLVINKNNLLAGNKDFGTSEMDENRYQYKFCNRN